MALSHGLLHFSTALDRPPGTDSAPVRRKGTTMSRNKRGYRLGFQTVIAIAVALAGFVMMPVAPSFAAPPNPTVNVTDTCDTISISISGYSDSGPQLESNHVETRVDGQINGDGTGDFSTFAQIDVPLDGTASHDWEVTVTSWDGPEGNITQVGTTIPCNGNGPDADGDGVPDATDDCANTPVGESVDANGCSGSQLDEDNDGVNNANDDCPNTPAGTSVDANGCPEVGPPADDDNDGVPNGDDDCPNTPAGEEVDANGCSVNEEPDSDGDGVPNSDDLCPDTLPGAEVNEAGCSSEVPLGDVTVETGCKTALVTNNEAVGGQLVYGVYPDTADDQVTIGAGETLKITTSRALLDIVVNFDDNAIGSVFYDDVQIDQVCDGNGGGDGEPVPGPVPTNPTGGSPEYGVPDTGGPLSNMTSGSNPLSMVLIGLGLIGLVLTAGNALRGRRRSTVV